MHINVTTMIILLVFLWVFTLTALGLSGYSMTTEKVDIINYTIDTSIKNDVTVDDNLTVVKDFNIVGYLEIKGDTTINTTMNCKKLIGEVLTIGNEIVTSQDIKTFLDLTQNAEVRTGKLTLSLPGSVSSTTVYYDVSTLESSLFTASGTTPTLYNYRRNPSKKTLTLFTLEEGMYFVNVNAEGSMATRPANDVDFTMLLTAYNPSLDNSVSNTVFAQTINLKNTNANGFLMNAGFSLPFSDDLFLLGFRLMITYGSTGETLPSDWVFTTFTFSLVRLT